jgi:integrase
VKQLGGSGKTISNKHGFVSGAFNAAVRAGVMASNPCQGRRLPHTRVEETVFLTPLEFVLLRDHVEKQRWKNLATWLVTTGMRFSEASALTAADIDADAKTCRITKAWKYSGDYRPEIVPAEDKEVDPHHQPAARCTRRPSTSQRRASCSPTAPATPFAHRSFTTGGGRPARDSAMKAGTVSRRGFSPADRLPIIVTPQRHTRN